MDKIDNNLKQLNDSLSRIANDMDLLVYPQKQLQNYIASIVEEREKFKEQYLEERSKNADHNNSKLEI